MIMLTHRLQFDRQHFNNITILDFDLTLDSVLKKVFSQDQEIINFFFSGSIKFLTSYFTAF